MEEEIEWVSKTQMKKEMNALQKMGMRLTDFTEDTLNKANLPEHIVAAVLNHQKIRTNSALKRQAQYIGRLMRELDEQEVGIIEAFLARIDGENQAHNALMQRLDQWRTRLLAEDSALTEYIDQHPQAAIAELRTLIRNARKEAELNKPPKAYRALFQYLKKQNILEEQ